MLHVLRVTEVNDRGVVAGGATIEAPAQTLRASVPYVEEGLLLVQLESGHMGLMPTEAFLEHVPVEMLGAIH